MTDLKAYLAEVEAQYAAAVDRMRQAAADFEKAKADANAAAGAVQAVRKLIADEEKETEG